MWPNPQFLADLVTFTEEILNGKLHFLCNAKEIFKHVTEIREKFAFFIRRCKWNESKFHSQDFHHFVKSVQIRSYFWSVFCCIRTESRKIRTRNNSVFGHFSRSAYLPKRKELSALRQAPCKTFTKIILCYGILTGKQSIVSLFSLHVLLQKL